VRGRDVDNVIRWGLLLILIIIINRRSWIEVFSWWEIRGGNLNGLFSFILRLCGADLSNG
jgi:hypothetical protein